ncbi:hypothetical protein K456DRAFT_1737962 [Colletotrichum gloeosporioides 23]|nr:hypothetical protein K456DRAFT_1737962 [Colletotrichum gloeosporioides 23]
MSPRLLQHPASAVCTSSADWICSADPALIAPTKRQARPSPNTSECLFWACPFTRCNGAGGLIRSKKKNTKTHLTIMYGIPTPTDDGNIVCRV